jgi:hypothetical protein
VGALLGRIYDNWAKRTSNPEFAERMGVLLATGLIVGESLFGVVFAMLVGTTGKDTPLALVEENPWAMPLSIALFAAAVAGLYLWTKSRASVAPLIDEHDAVPPEQGYR